MQEITIKNADFELNIKINENVSWPKLTEGFYNALKGLGYRFDDENTEKFEDLAYWE